MKHSILYVALAALACTACHKQTFDERVQAEVEHFNQMEAPKQLDTFTRFDSMAYDAKTLTLSYFYTITGDIDISQYPIEEAQQYLLGNLRNSIQMKAYKERDINFHYIYFSGQTGEPVVECTFTPEDYRHRVQH